MLGSIRQNCLLKKFCFRQLVWSNDGSAEVSADEIGITEVGSAEVNIHLALEK